ncbi:hypothetical protein B0H34DRAFT_807734 [Crassisporium funariophilum]|nr:hypothetical protein B0H34DRAFT_807734 [Crassisporium funariophilum]
MSGPPTNMSQEDMEHFWAELQALKAATAQVGLPTTEQPTSELVETADLIVPSAETESGNSVPEAPARLESTTAPPISVLGPETGPTDPFLGSAEPATAQAAPTGDVDMHDPVPQMGASANSKPREKGKRKASQSMEEPVLQRMLNQAFTSNEQSGTFQPSRPVTKKAKKNTPNPGPTKDTSSLPLPVVKQAKAKVKNYKSVAVVVESEDEDPAIPKPQDDPPTALEPARPTPTANPRVILHATRIMREVVTANKKINETYGPVPVSERCTECRKNDSDCVYYKGAIQLLGEWAKDVVTGRGPSVRPVNTGCLMCTKKGTYCNSECTWSLLGKKYTAKDGDTIKQDLGLPVKLDRARPVASTSRLAPVPTPSSSN